MTEETIQNYPVYSIGVVSDFLGVNPAIIRSWEKSGVIDPPNRRGGKRFYSEYDLKRLRFIQNLLEEGLTLPAIRHYLRLYPCWEMDDCPECMSRTSSPSCAKPCWKEAGTYCQVSANEDLCAKCANYHKRVQA